MPTTNQILQDAWWRSRVSSAGCLLLCCAAQALGRPPHLGPGASLNTLTNLATNVLLHHTMQIMKEDGSAVKQLRSGPPSCAGTPGGPAAAGLVLSTLGAPVVAGPAAAGGLLASSSSNKQLEAGVQVQTSHHPKLQQQCDRHAAQDVGQLPLPAAAAAGQVPASKAAETKAPKPVSADVTTRCCTSKAKVCVLPRKGVLFARPGQQHVVHAPPTWLWRQTAWQKATPHAVGGCH